MRKVVLFGMLVFFISTANAAFFSLHSTGFDEGDKLDSIYTCEGDNISPQLQWEHAPAKTVSFTLIFSDPDAPSGTFYHWAIFNIPRTVNTLAEDIVSLPNGAHFVKNSWEKTDYNGPCPPSGQKHRYIFRIYALDTLLKLDDEADVQILLNAIQNHVLGVAELKAVFARE